jgi:hypothetical protein
MVVYFIISSRKYTKSFRKVFSLQYNSVFHDLVTVSYTERFFLKLGFIKVASQWVQQFSACVVRVAGLSFGTENVKTNRIGPEPIHVIAQVKNFMSFLSYHDFFFPRPPPLRGLAVIVVSCLKNTECVEFWQCNLMNVFCVYYNLQRSWRHINWSFWSLLVLPHV